MNLCEGRIGRQEATSLTAFGVAVSGLFYPNAASLYAHGNANYLAAPVTLALLMLLFTLVIKAMARRRAPHLGAFLCDALGGGMGRVAALAVVAYLVVAAAVPLIQFQLAMDRYVFPNSPVLNVCLYFLPPLLGLSFAGLETLGRTARLCLWPLAVALALPLILAIPSYRVNALFPLALEEPLFIARGGVMGLSRMLAPLLSLLICTRGVFGVQNACRYGRIAIVAGGLFVCVAQLCVGLTYCYLDLRDMVFPFYRMVMTSYPGVYLRMDKLLLFFWLVTGALCGAFYLYAAALLYCHATGVRDVRPAALSLSACAVTLTALASLDTASWLRNVAAVIVEYLYLPALLPPVLASLVAFCRKERRKA